MLSYCSTGGCWPSTVYCRVVGGYCHYHLGCYITVCVCVCVLCNKKDIIRTIVVGAVRSPVVYCLVIVDGGLGLGLD